MTSILTNVSALAALSTLRMIDQNLNDTQNQVSSGYRVGSAKDNAAYWSISTTMKSDNAALSAVSDALGLAASKTDTAYNGMNSAIDIVSQIKAKLVAAREPGVDKGKVESEIDQLKSQLSSIAQSASFSGENWLYNDSTNAAGTKEMVGNFVRAADGTVSVGVISYDASKSILIDTVDATKGLLTQDVAIQEPTGTTTTAATYYLIAGTGTGASGTEVKISSTTTNSDVEGMISAVDSMLQKMTDAASNLGAVNTRITTQSNFVSSLMSTIEKGVGRLVDADMNEASTKLKALQTQQQLAIQALSISNSNSQNILSLFR